MIRPGMTISSSTTTYLPIYYSSTPLRLPFFHVGFLSFFVSGRVGISLAHLESISDEIIGAKLKTPALSFEPQYEAIIWRMKSSFPELIMLLSRYSSYSLSYWGALFQRELAYFIENLFDSPKKRITSTSESAIKVSVAYVSDRWLTALSKEVPIPSSSRLWELKHRSIHLLCVAAANVVYKMCLNLEAISLYPPFSVLANLKAGMRLMTKVESSKWRTAN